LRAGATPFSFAGGAATGASGSGRSAIGAGGEGFAGSIFGAGTGGDPEKDFFAAGAAAGFD
jgi:hypothetical protein